MGHYVTKVYSILSERENKLPILGESYILEKNLIWDIPLDGGPNCEGPLRFEYSEVSVLP